MRGDTAKVSPANTLTVRALHTDSAIGSVKSHTRAGAPLRSSSTRPANNDCVPADAPPTSTPAEIRWRDSPAPDVTRAPTDHVRSDPMPGSSSVGTGPSRSRSITIAESGVRSLDRCPIVNAANARTPPSPPANRRCHDACV